MIRIKQGVVIAGLDPVGGILEPALAAEDVWRGPLVCHVCSTPFKLENIVRRWEDVWITGGIDGNHMTNSWHYRGMGLDLRLPPDPAKAVVELAKVLPNWRVMLEGDHIHCQRK